MMEFDDLQTIDATRTAELLGKHVDDVYRLAKLPPEKGGIPCIRLGAKSVRFRIGALRAWMEQQEQDGIRQGA